MTRTPARSLARMAALVAVTATPVLAVAPASLAATPATRHPGQVAARHGHGHGTHTPDHGQVQRAINQVGRLGARHLTLRTHFTMAPDGSGGRTAGGEGIPNIDVVKSTIRTYYGAGSDGIANRQHSPYVTQLDHILKQEAGRLKQLYRQAERDGKKPALVFDADDTTLMTYDMEDAAMHFSFDPQLQNTWVQQERFPATPGMVAFVKKAQRMGFTIFGLTGRNDDQKTATLGNLRKVGYGDAFTAGRFYTKWTGQGDSRQPGYITCAVVNKCTTVEFKAGTRAHLEQLGYDIALNVGDQWSDLQGGSADHWLKLPNPTYYLPSPDLPGRHEPWMSPRTHFTMKADGSSGRTAGGEGIPNIDVVKSTIRTYYGAGSDGTANKIDSPYVQQMHRITAAVTPALTTACTLASRAGIKPAIVLDADDTTLMTYDMEDGAMHFHFDPVVQNDDWVQPQRFPATPGMVRLVNAAASSGCTLIGLTGRGAAQKDATLGNLRKVGYTGFTAGTYYTKWAAGQQPSYIHCATGICSTIEYKSQTRAHVQSPAGGGYTILANFGDQFSDLIGGHALVPVKLPNPTYYLP